jgi:hypothetical protein
MEAESNPRPHMSWRMKKGRQVENEGERKWQRKRRKQEKLKNNGAQIMIEAESKPRPHMSWRTKKGRQVENEREKKAEGKYKK